MSSHAIEIDVRYVETDRMQVVHHSAYLPWFELGRTSLLAHAGYPYRDLERSGVMFPVIEYSCRMLGTADYGDRIRIETTIVKLQSRAVAFEYRALKGDELIATGATYHIAVGADHRPKRMPAALVDSLQSYVKS